jgi:mRNA interferase YafQ
LLEIKIEKSFKKDIHRDKRSGQYSKKDFSILKSLITSLQIQDKIDPKHKRHPLKGILKEFESIHIKNDWLLIFKIDEQYLNLVMLGKHTQIYEKFK